MMDLTAVGGEGQSRVLVTYSVVVMPLCSSLCCCCCCLSRCDDLFCFVFILLDVMPDPTLFACLDGCSCVCWYYFFSLGVGFICRGVRCLLLADRGSG